MSVHGYDRSALPSNVIPPNWCRYVAIDPGHTVTAALFAAVPPDGDLLLVYDELYLRQCNAVKFGEAMLQKTHGQQYHAFIMDMHGGRIREIGSGRLPVEIYSEQLRLHDIKSTITGHNFLAGSDDVQGRMAETQKVPSYPWRQGNTRAKDPQRCHSEPCQGDEALQKHSMLQDRT